jgi:hypothetical protein
LINLLYLNTGILDYVLDIIGHASFHVIVSLAVSHLVATMLLTSQMHHVFDNDTLVSVGDSIGIEQTTNSLKSSSGKTCIVDSNGDCVNEF